MQDDFFRAQNKLEAMYDVLIKPATKIQMAWNIAPKLPALLRTLAATASVYKPTPTGVVGAALSSQKSVPKTQFIRAIGYLLSEEYGVDLSTNIYKAIAITTMVVLNNPEMDVSYDDVRKVIE